MSIRVEEFISDWCEGETPIPFLPREKDGDFVGVGSLNGKDVCVYLNSDDCSDKVASLTLVTPATRASFWDEVKTSNLVVYEGSSEAIVGIVKFAGATHVAYDQTKFKQFVSRSFTESDRTVSKSARVDEEMDAYKRANFGTMSPIFVTVIVKIQD